MINLKAKTDLEVRIKGLKTEAQVSSPQYFHIFLHFLKRKRSEKKGEGQGRSGVPA